MMPSECEILAAAARRLAELGQVEAIRIQRAVVDSAAAGVVNVTLPMRGAHVPVAGVHPYLDVFSVIALNDD